MRKCFALMAVVLLVATTATAFARVDKGAEPRVMLPSIGDFGSDIPARAPIATRADTTNFGFYDPTTGYAVVGERWTFDHNAADPFEGWTSIDKTQNIANYWRQITAANWVGHGNWVPAPVITGTGSIWVGAFENEADLLCWEGGLGYGNSWCQILTSPTLQYSGSGGLTLSLKYFNDCETDFDYTKIFVVKGDTRIQMNESALNAKDGFTDKINITCVDTTCTLNIPPTPWTSTVTGDLLGGAGSLFIEIRFEADGGWSDQDGDWLTYLGPFGADDVVVSGGVPATSYAFESNLEGWTPSMCPGIGSYFSIQNMSSYSIPDPCGCTLSGNVAAFHSVTSWDHVYGQEEMASSNIIDRRAHLAENKIFCDYDMYYDMPGANGVYMRYGYDYYPFVCVATGLTGWSGRQGDRYWYAYLGPGCGTRRDIATDWGIPQNSDYIRLVFEVQDNCENFGIPSTTCTYVSNFSPLFDNVRLRTTGAVNAPAITFNPGTTFQDGFPQINELETNAVGMANTSQDRNMQNETRPDILGDSLVVAGPTVGTDGSGSWQARMWFRVKREGPAQRSIQRYNTWLQKVRRGGPTIVGPSAPFAYGWMDSIEAGTLIQKNIFCSQYAEYDPNFVGQGSGGVQYDQGEDNEIIWDDMLTPGTKIEYFTSSNWTCTPADRYLLPDTAGAFFREFEILPSYRMVGRGVAKFPCVLYVDAFNGGSQTYIENALNVVLNGNPPLSTVPDPTNWDRYDYENANTNGCAPLFRGALAGSNNGATMPQLLGYKTIIFSTGTQIAACTPRDWTGFGDWLQFVDCAANATLQGIIMNGDGAALIMSLDRPEGVNFMNNYLGASFQCTDYNDPNCPTLDPDNDINNCVRLEYAPGGPWVPTLASDVFANWCPSKQSYDVLGKVGSGVGNKLYGKIGTTTMTEFAQVTNDQKAPISANNFRAVLDGFSYHHMAQRDLGNPGGETECPSDLASVVQASYNEINSAIKWTFNISDPLNIGLCIDPCVPPEPNDVPDQIAGGKINMLYQNNPNPFNPRTAIKFSLAADGPAKLVIYDVNGRQVKTLVQGRQTAGPHEIVWDGTNDAGHTVGSGVYWSKLTAGDYSSNKKMVVLK